MVSVCASDVSMEYRLDGAERPTLLVVGIALRLVCSFVRTVQRVACELH